MQARATLEEFEATVARDSTKSPPADGTVHPLAASTLTFMKRLFGYDAALEALFGQDPANGCVLCVAHLCAVPCRSCRHYLIHQQPPSEK